MAGPTGRDANRNLENLLGAVREYGSEVQQEQASGAAQAGEHIGIGERAMVQTTGTQTAGHKRSWLSGSAIASLVSIIALAFSGFSFYETVLKQASLRIYAPPLIHMFREGYRDVLAIPITISNDGARRGTVLSFDLKVTDLKTNETKGFQNLHFGSSPKGEMRLFNPITVPGRSSWSGTVLFHALKPGAFVKTTGGIKLPLRLILKMNLDRSAGWLDTAAAAAPLTFDMTASYIASFSEMERGRPTELHDKRWQQSKAKAASGR